MTPTGKTLLRAPANRFRRSRQRQFDFVFMTSDSGIWVEDSVLGECEQVICISREALSVDKFLKNGSILLNHDPNQIVGAPTSVCIDEKAGTATVRVKFAKTPLAREAAELVRTGFLRGASAGYFNRECFRLKKGEHATLPTTGRRIIGPAKIITKCELIEVSVVPVGHNPNAVLISEGARNVF